MNWSPHSVPSSCSKRNYLFSYKEMKASREYYRDIRLKILRKTWSYSRKKPNRWPTIEKSWVALNRSSITLLTSKEEKSLLIQKKVCFALARPITYAISTVKRVAKENCAISQLATQEAISVLKTPILAQSSAKFKRNAKTNAPNNSAIPKKSSTTVKTDTNAPKSANIATKSVPIWNTNSTISITATKDRIACILASSVTNHVPQNFMTTTIISKRLWWLRTERRRKTKWLTLSRSGCQGKCTYAQTNTPALSLAVRREYVFSIISATPRFGKSMTARSLTSIWLKYPRRRSAWFLSLPEDYSMLGNVHAKGLTAVWQDAPTVKAFVNSNMVIKRPNIVLNIGIRSRWSILQRNKMLWFESRLQRIAKMIYCSSLETSRHQRTVMKAATEKAEGTTILRNVWGEHNAVRKSTALRTFGILEKDTIPTPTRSTTCTSVPSTGNHSNSKCPTFIKWIITVAVILPAL